MPVAPINQNNFLTEANYQSGALRTPSRTLKQDDFLRLVMAQLTNQDPLKPQQDTEFIAQMAQFTSLEQSKAMQGDIALLQKQQLFLQANSLLGRQVSVQDLDGSLLQGTVSSVEVHGGTPYLVVGGRLFDLDTLVGFAPAREATPPVTPPNPPPPPTPAPVTITPVPTAPIDPALLTTSPLP
ncbi:MAG: hypothetical protein RJA22_2619 [Verrucomicrobiota bacterium]|jgi:flagellar basal-body rod modification protein FlgD